MLSALTFLLAATATGIQFGWEPLATGGNTYIIQVEPELIDAFRKDGFASDVPPQLRDIRRIEIRVGAGTLPHQNEMTMQKVPDKLVKPAVAEATQAPRLDTPPIAGARPDLELKEPATTADAKLASNQPAPRQLPNTGGADPLPAAATTTVERPIVQTSERPISRADDGPSAAAASPGPRLERSGTGESSAAGAVDPALNRDPDRPWLPLLGALGALVVSAAGNLYLGWVHLGTRRRYHEVVNQLRESDLPIAITPPSQL